MKIYDISQEVFSCSVYPGDPAPKRERLCSMEQGSLYNLTAFSMCAHNGTHVDAPFHFLKDGKTVEKIPPEQVVGYAFVSTYEGELSSEDAMRILREAKSRFPESAKRILIRGNALVTLPAAEVFAQAGIFLLGVESQSVGPEDAPMAVHLALLRKDVVLLEGLRLSAVEDGVYFLSAMPLSLAGADGAPCRAILVDFENG
jgi:arylformamidase